MPLYRHRSYVRRSVYSRGQAWWAMFTHVRVAIGKALVATLPAPVLVGALLAMLANWRYWRWVPGSHAELCVGMALTVFLAEVIVGLPIFWILHLLPRTRHRMRGPLLARTGAGLAALPGVALLGLTYFTADGFGLLGDWWEWAPSPLTLPE